MSAANWEPHALVDLVSRGLGRERTIRRGEILFRQGEKGDYFYYLKRGRLRVLRESDDGGARQVVGEVGRGEVVGELAMLGCTVRSATVVAIRDCILTEMHGDAVGALPPEALMDVMRLLASRMRDMIERGAVPHAVLPGCIVILPTDEAVPAEAYCQRLIESIGRCAGKATLCRGADVPAEFRNLEATSGEALERLGHWLEDLEERSGLLILLADPAQSPWTECCLLRADLILLLARADANPEPGAAERAIAHLPGADKGALPRIDLVLLQDSEPFRGTARWLAPRQVTRHYHVRINSEADKDRAGRLLSGGGARGFAHLGLLRACEEMGVPIDRLGGTSMGATVGGLAAMGLGWEDARERLREHFLPKRKLVQYTLPVLSIDTGRKYVDMLDSLFGDVRIEDLPLNYFCVTCNLTRAEVRVHRDGRLAHWVGTSMTLPGMVPPFIDRGEILVDGGLLNNLPINIVKAEGAGMVVGVDVSPGGGFRLPAGYTGRPQLWDAVAARAGWRRGADGKPLRFPSIAAILFRAASLSSVVQKTSLAAEADLYIKMPVERIPILAFEQLDKMVAIGYMTGMSELAPALDWSRTGRK
jgi:predicted acylesterase/phospholipase RssA/CRP-like cAMP-binding protein